MAALTWDARVLAPQGESVSIVKRRVANTGLDHLPASGHVARLAVLTKAPVVDVFVTVATAGVGDVDHLHERCKHRRRKGIPTCASIADSGMAFLARHPRVLPRQRKITPSVVETGGWLEVSLIVTFTAGLPQLSPVLIEMALLAKRSQPQERFLAGELPQQRDDGVVLNETLLMAIGAGVASVLASQGPSGFLMVKGVSAPRTPINDLSVPAQVFDVTRSTRTLTGRHAAMKPAPVGDAFSEFLMAFQTSIRSDDASRRVAFETVVNAVEIGVSCGKFARR